MNAIIALYERLRHGAALLRETRHSHMSEPIFQKLITAFDEQVGPEWSARLPRTGGLLAAAVADERAGTGNAVSSVAGWMTDPERFPEHWRDAVADIIRRAREPVG